MKLVWTLADLLWNALATHIVPFKGSGGGRQSLLTRDGEGDFKCVLWGLLRSALPNLLRHFVLNQLGFLLDIYSFDLLEIGGVSAHELDEPLQRLDVPVFRLNELLNQ